MKEKSIEQQLKEMTEYVEELKIRLLTLLDIIHNILPRPGNRISSIDRLLSEDYTAYCEIVSYCCEKKKSVITTHLINREIITGRSYRDLEITLYNLQKLGLVELTVGNNQYLEVSLVGSTKFQEQKEKNKLSENKVF